jgi:hypothetical protein
VPDPVCRQTGGSAAAKRRDLTTARGPYAFLIVAVSFRLQSSFNRHCFEDALLTSRGLHPK